MEERDWIALRDLLRKSRAANNGSSRGWLRNVLAALDAVDGSDAAHLLYDAITEMAHAMMRN